MLPTDIIVPVIGILGTIAGIVLGGGLTSRAERVKAIRDQQKQWRDLRVKAYVSLLQSITDQIDNVVERTIVQVDLYAANQDGRDAGELRERLAVLEKSRQSAKLAVAEAELLGSDSIVESAGRLVKALDAHDDAFFRIYPLTQELLSNPNGMREESDDDRAERTAANDALGAAKIEVAAARSVFRSQAQRELGLD